NSVYSFLDSVECSLYPREFVNSVVNKFPWVETAFNAVKEAINAVWEAIKPYVEAIGTAIAVTLSIIATVMSFQQVWLALVAVLKLVGAAIGYVFALLLRNPIALTIGLIVGLVQAF